MIVNCTPKSYGHSLAKLAAIYAISDLRLAAPTSESIAAVTHFLSHTLCLESWEDAEQCLTAVCRLLVNRLAGCQAHWHSWRCWTRGRSDRRSPATRLQQAAGPLEHDSDDLSQRGVVPCAKVALRRGFSRQCVHMLARLNCYLSGRPLLPLRARRALALTGHGRRECEGKGSS